LHFTADFQNSRSFVDFDVSYLEIMRNLRAIGLLCLLTLLFCSSVFSATYYSQGSGDPNTLALWNDLPGGGGALPPNFVTSGDNFVVQNGNTLTNTAVWTVGVAGSTGRLQIEPNAILKADFQVVLFSTMTFQIDAGGRYIHNNTSSMASGIFAGVESFDIASTVEYQNVAASPARPFGGYGNVTINFPAAATTNAGFASGTETIRGDLTVTSTGVANTATGQGSWRIATGTNTNTIVNGNYIHNGGILIVCQTSACNNTDVIGPQLRVNNFTLNGGNVIVNSSTTASPILQSYFQVNGNALINAGNLSLVQTFGATAANIGQVGEFRVKGNLTNAGGTITRPNGSSGSRVIFNGTGGQVFTMPAATPLGNGVSVSVYPGASVTLGSNLTHGTTAAQLDVMGTLNSGGFTLGINQLNIGCTGSSTQCPAFGQPPTPVNTGIFNLTGGTLNMNSGGTASITNWASGTVFIATNAAINMNNSSSADWVNSGTVSIADTNLTVGGSSGPSIQINATGIFNVRGASNVTLGTNASLIESQLNILSGGRFNWTDAGSIAAEAKFSPSATSGTLTTGTGGISNAGSFVMNGTIAGCGQADSILMRSSAPGTARPITGAGTFTLSDIDIQDQNSTPAISVLSGTNSGNNTSITFATCTPTAADATIRGRLLTSTGRGLMNAYVLLTNTNTGEVKTARTTTLGYFNFRDLQTGDFYIVSVNSKRYQFNNQSFTLDENLDDLVLTAQP
jgi:hypothetical protein